MKNTAYMKRLPVRARPAVEIITKVTLVCRECGHTARRRLLVVAGSRGAAETPCEPGLCPQGHGPLTRQRKKAA